MLATSLIQIAIALVFIFSLMAILVTQINAILLALLNLRAKELKDGLKYMITDTHVRAKVLAHPIINVVQAKIPVDVDLTNAQAKKVAEIAETAVDYIPPPTFVEALISILIADSDKNLFTQLQQAVDKLPSSREKSEIREAVQKLRTGFSEREIRELFDLIDTVTDDVHRAELIAGLQAVEEAVQMLRYKNSELIPLLHGINRIQDRRFKSALQSIITTADDIGEARIKIESWFNDGMDRVTKVFVGKVQVISIIVAFLLSLVLNVDTLFLARSLWEDPDLRSSVAAAAQQFDQTGVVQPLNQVGQTGPSVIVPEVPATAPSGKAAAQAEATLDNNLDDLSRSVKAAEETINQLLALQLPIGWQFITITPELRTTSQISGLSDPITNSRNLWNYWPGNNSDWFQMLFQKIIGIVITTVAAAQGSSFWFDILKRLTNTAAPGGSQSTVIIQNDSSGTTIASSTES